MKSDLDIIKTNNELKLLKTLLDVCINSSDTNTPMSFFVKRIDIYHLKIHELIKLSDEYFNIKIDA